MTPNAREWRLILEGLHFAIENRVAFLESRRGNRASDPIAKKAEAKATQYRKLKRKIVAALLDEREAAKRKGKQCQGN